MTADRSHWPGLLFDTHCHLHFDRFGNDLEAVIQRASDQGVKGILIPSVDLESSRLSSGIAHRFGLWSAAGFHPNHLENATEESFKEVARLSLLPQAAAVGETGLDYHRRVCPGKTQRRWFSRHIRLASDLGMPLAVHSRGAEEDVLDQLPEAPSFPVILHSWEGSRESTEMAVERGFFFGVTGAVTYRKSRPAALLNLLPRDRVLVETDAPFLPPEPRRGERNEPGFSPLTAGRIAREWGLSRGETLDILWGNALRALGLQPGNRRTHLVYPMGDNLYVNLTGMCSSSCVFCIRERCDGIRGYYLRHGSEPSRKSVLDSLEAADPGSFREVVFCGYGEPTMRPGLLIEAADLVSAAGGKSRLNTNGLCLHHMTPDETRTMLGRFGRVSVSLNASGAAEYERICPNRCSDGWENLMAFIRLVTAMKIPAMLTAVAGSGADIPRVQALAERIGLPLRIRGGS